MTLHTKSSKDRLYFFYSKTLNQYKIGRSVSPKTRVKAMYTAGTEVEVVSEIENAGHLEFLLHEAFDKYRAIGEWFKPNNHLEWLIDLSKKCTRDVFVNYIELFFSLSESEQFIINSIRNAKFNLSRGRRVSNYKTDLWRVFGQDWCLYDDKKVSQKVMQKLLDQNVLVFNGTGIHQGEKMYRYSLNSFFTPMHIFVDYDKMIDSIFDGKRICSPPAYKIFSATIPNMRELKPKGIYNWT